MKMKFIIIFITKVWTTHVFSKPQFFETSSFQNAIFFDSPIDRTLFPVGRDFDKSGYNSISVNYLKLNLYQTKLLVVTFLQQILAVYLFRQ